MVQAEAEAEAHGAVAAVRHHPVVMYNSEVLCNLYERKNIGMFDKEQTANYDRRAEYDERVSGKRSSVRLWRNDKLRNGREIGTARPFWTRAKVISAVVIVLVVLGGIICFSQNISIQQRQYDVQGKVGNVWNEVDRASQLLQQNAALLNSTIASQNPAINKIAERR